MRRKAGRWVLWGSTAAVALLGGCDGESSDDPGDGGSGGSGLLCDDVPSEPSAAACPAGEYVPTPQDVQFAALAAVPAGEQILFNDWAVPDTVRSMAPDGANVVDIFRAFRVWSMAVSGAGDRLAFSCGDPDQEQNYGITIGDAIQLTWLYDFSTQSIELAGCGNINDECHQFSPDDQRLYVCRRYDFTSDGQHSGYHIGAYDLRDGTFALRVSDSDPMKLFLSPQVTPDGCELWYSSVEIQAGSQSRTIQKMALPGGAPELVRSDAHRPALSPDGTRYVYADTTAQSALFIADIDGSNVTPIASANGTSATFSPDGSQIAYTVWDDAHTCSHVEVVATDGSQVDSPTRIRDCGVTGEFITELQWIVRP